MVMTAMPPIISISPVFGFEGGFFKHYFAPQTLYHLIENMIMEVSCIFLTNFQSHMAIAEVITDPGEKEGITGPDG
jgi:hypothetical protein